MHWELIVEYSSNILQITDSRMKSRKNATLIACYECKRMEM